MRVLITTTIAAAGFVIAASSAYADGITDFWSLQKGYGYDAATQPAAPAGWPLYQKWLGPQPAAATAAQPAAVHHATLRHVKHGKVIRPTHG
ncbi:hypothetical protein LMIY3S_05417 [Labrys miyagiensis]